jgi:hypothetical protein
VLQGTVTVSEMVTDTMISTPMQEREGTVGVVGVEIG